MVVWQIGMAHLHHANDTPSGISIPMMTSNTGYSSLADKTGTST